MRAQPKTRKEAEKRLYGKPGQYMASPDGVPYYEKFCAYEVKYQKDYSGQCCRNPGHGQDGLYCRFHAKKMEAQPQ